MWTWKSGVERELLTMQAQLAVDLKALKGEFDSFKTLPRAARNDVFKQLIRSRYQHCEAVWATLRSVAWAVALAVVFIWGGETLRALFQPPAVTGVVRCIDTLRDALSGPPAASAPLPAANLNQLRKECQVLLGN